MNTLFTELLPNPELTPYIQTYWLGNFNVQNEKRYRQRVVPNGCIELIVHLTNDHCYLVKNDQSWTKSPDFTLLGLFDQPYDVHFSYNVRVFGIRFFPDGLKTIFGIPPSEFISTYEDGSNVLGKKMAEFCLRIRELEDPHRQVDMANHFFKDQIHAKTQKHDYTHLAMKLIRSVKGMADYRELTGQVPISLRQLQREFKAHYGITVRDYMRLTRMNAIQSYMLTRDENLTQLSYELEFTDQSHFIREFKNYTGIAPKKFIRNKDKFIVNPAVK